MNFQKFTEISGMLIEGMESAVSMSHGGFDNMAFAKRVGEMVLSELESGDASLNKVWTEQQVPGLKLALEQPEQRTAEAILKLSAPGLVALSSESGENLKNLAYHVCFNAFQSLLGESLTL